MNTQEYIESGILEQYALGELNETERAEVERQAAARPEIQQALRTVVEALAAYAASHSLNPPTGMRERVLTGWQQAIAAPAPAADAVVRPIRGADVAEPAPSRFNWPLAASIALLLVSAAANLLLYSKWQNAEQSLAVAQREQTQLASTMQAVEKRLGQRNGEVAVLRSDQFRNVTLAGTPAAPAANARVLYNPTTRAVYVDVRNLPAPPAGKQYQLWALDNGKPVDAGVLAAATAAGDSLQLMKTIASAQAFAMTVEPTGGSESPTLSTMTVMGKM